MSKGSSLAIPGSSSGSLSASVEDMTTDDPEAEGEVSYLECDETSGYLIFNREVRQTQELCVYGGHIQCTCRSSTYQLFGVFGSLFLLPYVEGYLLSKHLSARLLILQRSQLDRVLYICLYVYVHHAVIVWASGHVHTVTVPHGSMVLVRCSVRSEDGSKFIITTTA